MRTHFTGVKILPGSFGDVVYPPLKETGLRPNP